MPLTTSHTLASNVQLLKGKTNKYAVYGVVIAFAAIGVATALVSYYHTGEITLAGIIEAQKINKALWLLDMMPFFFAMWGQYVGSVMAYEAGALVHDLVHEQTDELRAEKMALKQDASHDRVTELPNRALLLDRLGQALNVAQHEKAHLAILVMDLDRFKEINDTLGHYTGDRVLKQVAVRLKGTIQETDTVARFGGDEFAILLPKISAVDDATRVARKIGKALQTPFALEGLKLDVQASIGIAVFPEHGPDADTLLQRVDVAMYKAKKEKSGYVVYDPKLDEHSRTQLTLMGELRHAIDADQLILHYQPKVNIASRQVTGVEALVRWQHPGRDDLVRPDEFIERAEMTGLIKPLTKWVLNHALQQQDSWTKAGWDIGVAVNMSARDLLDVELPDLITGRLAAHSVAPERLILEITETSIMEDQERALQILTRLADMGVRLSIDDFGTGQSSLSYLSKLPVKDIKIDKSFVMDMNENAKHAMIVRATIDLAHNLGLEVIAEGTASEQILVQLEKLGCDAMQGEHISAPLSTEEFNRWIKESRWRPRVQSVDVKEPESEKPERLQPTTPKKESIESTIKEIEDFIGQSDARLELPKRKSKSKSRRRAG